MARVTGPLMSMDARGKLGNTLVFTGWKGIKTVRQFVIPANPNTAAQQTQRTRMSNTVATWKDIDSADRTAWGTWSGYEAKPMSGFNAYTKAQTKNLVEVATAHTAKTVTAAAAVESVDVACIAEKLTDRTAVASLTTLRVDYGTTPRDLGNTATLIWDAGSSSYKVSVASLVAGTTYYFRISDTALPYSISGIFTGVPTA